MSTFLSLLSWVQKKFPPIIHLDPDAPIACIGNVKPIIKANNPKSSGSKKYVVTGTMTIKVKKNLKKEGDVYIKKSPENIFLITLNSSYSLKRYILL